jgi:hypothetical protein
MVRSLVATNTIQEATQICWDLRPSERYLEDLQTKKLSSTLTEMFVALVRLKNLQRYLVVIQSA